MWLLLQHHLMEAWHMLIENKITVIEHFLKHKHGSDLVGLDPWESPIPHISNKTQRSDGIEPCTCVLSFYEIINK